MVAVDDANADRDAIKDAVAFAHNIADGIAHAHPLAVTVAHSAADAFDNARAHRHSRHRRRLWPRWPMLEPLAEPHAYEEAQMTTRRRTSEVISSR